MRSISYIEEYLRRLLRISVTLSQISMMFLFSCEGEEERSVVLAAKPPSIMLGSLSTSKIVANEAFFTEKIKTPIVSEKGLVLKNISREDSRNAEVLFESTEDTTPGLHVFELKIKDKTATLDISVLASEPGPGEIRLEGAEATSGVELGLLKILGDGTEFDEFCTVEARGAVGMKVHSANVKSPTEIEVLYAIDLDQEETVAEIVLRDGEYQYTAPFSIYRHKELVNTVNEQFLVKGSVGRIYLDHPEATIGPATVLTSASGRVEIGDTSSIDANLNYVLVRVPFDYEESSLSLQARTYSNGGAFLEILKVEVGLLPPAFLVASPAVLPAEEGIISVDIVANGIDLTSLESFGLQENGDLQLLDFEVNSSDVGTATFGTGATVAPGVYVFEAITGGGEREVEGFVVVSNSKSVKAHYLLTEIQAGNEVFLPVSVQSGDLLESTVRLTESAGMHVSDLIFIDNFSVVARIRTERDAFPAQRSMRLEGEMLEYPIQLEIVESEL